MQLWKSPNYANKFQNYSFVGDSWIPVWGWGLQERMPKSLQLLFNMFYFEKNNKKKYCTRRVSWHCSTFLAIMEETLTSGEYVPLFLISILNMNILNLKNYVTAGVFLMKITQKLASRENYASKEIKSTIFFIILQVMSIVIVYRPQ